MLRLVQLSAGMSVLPRVVSSFRLLATSRAHSRQLQPARAFAAAATETSDATGTAAALATSSPPTPSIRVRKPLSSPRPRPSRRHSWRQDLPPTEAWATPAKPNIDTQEQLDQLKRKGHDGSTYDMLACYQLGGLYFDGIPASKAHAATPTPAPAAATDAAGTSGDGGAPLELAPAEPWSLPRNYTQSLLWYTNAAFEGHVPSRTKLGVMYLAGYGIKRDVAVAFQLFTEASQSGDRDAMAHLASMYLQGVGAPGGKKDRDQAIHWYTKAADRGHVRAQATLAHLLHTAEPSHSRDLRAAAHWLHESARAGHTESQFRLAQQLEQAHPADAVELTRAYGWYRRAAQAGHAQAQYLLGLAYAENKPVVQAYYARPPTPSAVATPAVSQPPTTSPSSASSSSAASASSSSHLDRDQSAAKWFSRATDQGNVHAQARLGFALWNGVGVQPERGTAIMWLNNAAEANHADAQLMLGSIAYDEHLAASTSGGAAATTTADSKKLQMAKHYFGKVLENANKNPTSLPPGSLPLLVKLTLDPSLTSKLLAAIQATHGRPWLGDLNAFLRLAVPLSKTMLDTPDANSTPSHSKAE